MTEKYAKLIKCLDYYFEYRKIRVNIYILGAVSLIVQEILSRKTKDVDINVSEVDEATGYGLENYIKEETNLQIDLSSKGILTLNQGYSWIFPKSAFKRACKLSSSKWAKIYALHPLDILVLKLEEYRLHDRRDIATILKKLKPSLSELEEITKEYLILFKGSKKYRKNIIKNYMDVVDLAIKLGCK